MNIKIDNFDNKLNISLFYFNIFNRAAINSYRRIILVYYYFISISL